MLRIIRSVLPTIRATPIPRVALPLVRERMRNDQFSGLPPTHSFSTTTRRDKFFDSVMFGTAGGETRKKALEKEMCTDNYLFFGGKGACKEEDLEKYREAYVQFTGHEPPEDFQFERPWVLFNFADRTRLERELDEGKEESAMPFIHYGVQAARTALERGGQVVFNFNGWAPKLYMQQSLAAEVEHRVPFPQYLHWGPVPAPTITNLELGCFRERDDFKGLPIQYLSHSGQPLDPAKVAELFDAAVQACRSDENRARMADLLRDCNPRDDSPQEMSRIHGMRKRQIGRFEFDSAGRQALDALEKYIA